MVVERLHRRPLLIVLILSALFLTACGASQLGTNNNWPGLSAEGDVVYLAWGSHMTAIDAAQQRVVWSYPEEATTAALLASPEYHAGTLYIGDYGVSQGFFSPGVLAGVHAVTADNGTLDWTNPEVGTDRIVAGATEFEGKLFVGTADNMVIALDAANGNMIWQHELGHGVWGKPAAANGTVVVTSLDHTVTAFDVDSGSIRWSATLAGALAAGAVIDGSTVYVAGFDQAVTAFDLQSGTEQWQFSGQDWIWNSPTVADGRVYFADQSGTVYALSADSGTEIWRATVEGAIEAGVSVVNDQVYVATIIGVSTGDQSGRLISLSADNGTTEWVEQLSAPVFVMPTPVGDQLAVVLSGDEVEVAFYNQTDGRQSWSIIPAQSVGQ